MSGFYIDLLEIEVGRFQTWYEDAISLIPTDDPTDPGDAADLSTP